MRPNTCRGFHTVLGPLVDSMHTFLLQSLTTHIIVTRRDDILGYSSCCRPQMSFLRCTCTCVCIGWPGSACDTRTFVNSLIYKCFTEDGLLSSEWCTILGCQIPINIVGDFAYNIHTLTKSFGDNSNLTPKHTFLSNKLSRACMLDKNASGPLKARRRQLMKKNDINIEPTSLVISTQQTVFYATCVKFMVRSSTRHGSAQHIPNALMYTSVHKCMYNKFLFLQYHHMYTSTSGKWPIINMNI